MTTTMTITRYDTAIVGTMMEMMKVAAMMTKTMMTL